MKVLENKNIRRVLKISIILFALLILVKCDVPYTLADYNITSNYCKTEFNSSKWIQTYQNCTLNTTLGVFHLNKTEILPVYEDFTTWTEIGVVARLSQTTTRSTFTGLNRIDDNTYLYDTKTGELQNFVAIFRFKVTQITNSATTIRMSALTVTNTLNDYQGNKAGGKPQFGIQLRSWSSSTGYNLLLYETWSASLYYFGHTSNRLTVNTLYYVKLTKSGTALSLLVDNDSDFSSPINSYSLTLHANHNLPYIMIPQSLDLSGSLQVWGYAEYLDFGETSGGYEEKGVIYFKELLVNTTLKSLMIGINSTAITNTRIRLYTSSDNATWLLQIDNNGCSTKELYEEMLYEYASLYVRINLTTIDQTITPYLDELFYLHALNCTGVGDGLPPVVTNPWWLAILFISTPISIVLLYLSRRKR